MALWTTTPKWRRSRASRSWAENEAIRRDKLEELFRLLPEIGSFRRPARAYVRKKWKGHGRFRPICSFDWSDAARQRLVARSLLPVARLHRSQFMLTPREGGRGRTAACNTLLQRLEGRGDDLVFVQIDVREYFASISHQWLEERLGLPIEIIRNHVHTGGMHMVARGNATVRPSAGDLSELSRRGLPQGSALSSLVAEIVMADILEGLPVHLRDALIVYSDNPGLLLPRGEEAAVEELIRGVFGRHGAGPFDLTCTAKLVTDEFKFLGVWWRVIDGRPNRYVPLIVAERWALGMISRIMVADLAELPRLALVASGTFNEWKYWDGLGALRRDVLGALEAQQRWLGDQA
jgi:hypothetical protein